MDVTAVKSRIADLREENPMLGNRGCRLGITIPEIYQTQVQAIMKAALAVQKEGPVSLEIIVPLVSLAGEFRALKALIQETAEDVFTALGKRLDYQIGTMIELPRAALKADKIAYHADFLCFGTNDLTQTTFGFSRDDVGSFLPVYRKKGLLERDPFVSLDQSGVGELIQLAVTKARSVKPHIKMGVCGEQGADPASIHFFEKLCLDYVSCSPYRVPIARLSAAHATIDQGPTAQHPASQAL
jgi:pyruvate,orthophosphate dikinase